MIVRSPQRNNNPTPLPHKTSLFNIRGELTKLGLDYIDLYLIHRPQGDVSSSCTAMEELYREGKVRAIGVSNFNMNQIQNLLKNHSVIPGVNQVETHPFSQKTEMQKALKS
ncbi:aldo/keto reductase [Dyadobacter sp. UP-52]|uniref:Aldo/keto reductase n=1 Tax=Dyadobacter subterraneus TaxID=2773304 RepID=A0ABR9WE18_9BACT|nr:aldo/keto reductase [Dyadobacter subterraneus]MBE9463730.1 aldo/keto reductase [Dyadobacter subterraneus]